MTPVKKIEPPEWMRTEEVRTVTGALQGGAPEPQALFVGGCVRDELTGRRVEDIDIATVLTPDAVTEALAAAGVRVIPTGLDHGTVTAVAGDRRFEITTLRRDVRSTDGRHAEVAFSRDWVEDARRRDFTMNTLLADMDGHIYDPLGTGLADLAARTIRFVGDPAQRIAEDYLRILRFFRFAALYGAGDFDAEALAACEAAAGKIDSLSKERISQEFFKIMASDNPVDILGVMFARGVLKEFAFRDYDPEFLRAFCMFQSRYGLNALPSRLFVMANLDFANIRAMENHVIFPKVFLKDMQAIDGILALPDLDNDHAVKVAVYKFGRAASAQALMIELANDRVMNGYAPGALKIVQEWDVPMFPVSGADLKKAGIAPGPEMGKTLAAIEEWWIAEGFLPNQKACLGRC